MLENLIKKIEKNCSNEEIELVKKAYEIANGAHKQQKRESGEPYIVHPVEVACILADMGMDADTIVAGLLHDVIEDTEYTYEDVEREFNKEVADLVEGVTKLGKIKYKSKEEQQADNVRKMLLAMAQDVRVILIKLADRLHNMRTLKYMAVEKQKEKAKETFDIYAPLAHRLGISKIKWELEDLAFRYINPNEYYSFVKEIAERRVERIAYIELIVNELTKSLEGSGIKSDIEGRPKHFYSIYRKMINKNKTLDQIFDLTAIRILVDTVKDCYAALGIVHTMYKPIPGRFKDYIAMPKPNMYQSLHSTVIGPQGKPFEIQIRTFEMHKTAEYGIAAHWKYKEGITEENNMEIKLTWLREILEWQRETSDATEFMEGFKIDLFSDEVFVFTPKGSVINLPSKSTPIDFAYKIHTDIGNKCVGAKVNNRMVPLDYNLKTGEIVEIITSSNSKGPSIDWLSIVKSNQAKSKIKSWFKKAKREENTSKGKEYLEKEAKKQGYNFGEISKGEFLNTILKKYSFNSIEDLYAAVGIGELIASNIVLKFKEQHEHNQKANISNEEVIEDFNKNTKANKGNNKKSKRKKGNELGVEVKGQNNILVRFSKCCNPVPGDKIVGYITKGRGVSIHRRDCKNLQNLIDEDISKIIEVNWIGYSSGEYIAEIEVESEDKDGLLTQVMDIINIERANLYAINAKTTREKKALINIKLKISNIEQLENLMKKIRKLNGITDVYRTKN
ncbi:RelA/SpoT family protein [Clostridium tetani]|uniref:GTP diphosphokinase n=1 Tax=Clostridium tetani TaxID=1513 RepID=A0ABY0ERY0_CLOTA|nr:bifunctional (p)ppGpp synthetase/guanosine-3',5'-bis(diphosphate) 3'-pyrophosphohydrolase [Clostridium tetani]CDI50369.1 GTP pyrophosphokinase [Clostridium tetani 12124569]KHO36261.1 (p)ppGpp synthetase [Clostridium tetani]RXI39190.1 bifunctional (p)ppGpp synthetase/guanosine-3',5'-bis(diphosphate) 3'-pyrophosphohydrolase [Clostridium tetani]RXI55978.1 bifunctional (p)ppGpp synthetase/guanosine-3',5'-bis(diphosphate) 3'-pyrophosphohydrolase [Clostridium tetani]RXI66103.1 bifunctional (p)ppG